VDDYPEKDPQGRELATLPQTLLRKLHEEKKVCVPIHTYLEYSLRLAVCEPDASNMHVLTFCFNCVAFHTYHIDNSLIKETSKESPFLPIAETPIMPISHTVWESQWVQRLRKILAQKKTICLPFVTRRATDPLCCFFVVGPRVQLQSYL